MRFISVDGEFSGLDHQAHELISIGLCDCYDPKDSLYVEIKPSKSMDANATKIHGLTEDYLKKNAMERSQAAKKIHQWLSDKKSQLIFVGYPVVLDWIFLDQLFKEANLEMPFHYEQLDIHTMGVSLLGMTPGFSEADLREKLNLSGLVLEEQHNALYDARVQAEEFVALYKLINRK